MNRITKAAVIAGIAGIGLIGTAGAASASVQVTDGVGWVGKGDVQTALGMNNEGIQTAVNTDQVNFTYTVTDTYLVTEEFYTGPDRNRTQHEVTKTTTYVVNDVVNYDGRMVKGQKQWTGFNLTGLAGGISSGEIPAVGDHTVIDPQNPGTNSDHIVIAVEQTGHTGGLYVNGVPLPNTAG